MTGITYRVTSDYRYYFDFNNLTVAHGRIGGDGVLEIEVTPQVNHVGLQFLNDTQNDLMFWGGCPTDLARAAIVFWLQFNAQFTFGCSRHWLRRVLRNADRNYVTIGLEVNLRGEVFFYDELICRIINL